MKGRDWYDFEWFVRNGIAMNLTLFIVRGMQSGHFHEERLSELDFRNLLVRRIEALDVAAAVKDVSRFVKDVDALKIWSGEYFKDLVLRINSQIRLKMGGQMVSESLLKIFCVVMFF